MSKVIPYETLVRQQHLSFIQHQSREYREREDYLLRLRRLLFQVEAQMRQTEIQQLEAFKEVADHFQIPLKFPDMGDRLGFQQFFNTHPLLVAVQEFYGGKITAAECLEKILELKSQTPEAD